MLCAVGAGSGQPNKLVELVLLLSGFGPYILGLLEIGMSPGPGPIRLDLVQPLSCQRTELFTTR